jgi:mycoredoxin
LSFTVTAYTTHWCSDSSRSKRLLHRAGVEFTEIDIEKSPAAEDEMRAVNGGSGKVPTIVIESDAGRTVLVEPSDGELKRALCLAEELAL